MWKSNFGVGPVVGEASGYHVRPMTDVQTQIEVRLRDAVEQTLGEQYRDADPLLGPATNPKFGDYQANLAMGLAKRIGNKPRELAEKIVASLETAGLIDKAEVAGPGFINLTLAPAVLEQQATAMLDDADDRLGVPAADAPQTIVVDYSGPNVAKEMHIGHLRSTGIGDAIARILRFQGHRVIGQNHLGDWGTQFGMLIEHMVESGQSGEGEIGDLNTFYQAAKQRFDDDADFADRARRRVVALQSGDEETLGRWRELVELSKRHFDAIYQRLDIDTELLQYRPESAYNPMLPGVIDDLDKADLLKQSEGAAVVFPEGFRDREGEPMPMIVRKRDGGYLYATTDLAAARYRIEQLHADRLIYVTDARQSQHFAMVFQTLRQAGWARDEVRLDHVAFGAVLGKDRRPFKTRSGGTVRLAEVLDEAEQRADGVIREKNPDLDEAQRREIAHAVGVGALKYADLSTDRIKDYIFDWQRMLALDGNTAPYLQNAYVRIRSIFRKADADGSQPAGIDGTITITHEAERALILHLLRLPQTIASVAESLEPHRLTNYLYDLAAAYHQFYEACPVLSAPDEATRLSRLRLSELTARTLKKGLDLLGIGVVEKM